MKKVIVDIDNTLWDLAAELYERMARANSALIPSSQWLEFDFWKKYVSPREFYGMIKGIHLDQEKFVPYPDAAAFLSSLKEIGFHIVIASHREKGTLGATERWLGSNGLAFDEIHLSYDKTVLFSECCAVVDDSPFTLHKAQAAGIVATGLKMPWNKNGNYHLFDTLAGVLQYVKKTCLP